MPLPGDPSSCLPRMHSSSSSSGGKALAAAAAAASSREYGRHLENGRQRHLLIRQGACALRRF